MYVPPFMKHRRDDEDGRKQPRHDVDDDEDNQKQEHKSRCSGKSNSLLFLLSLLLTVVVVGSGFFFSNFLPTVNILRSGENVRPHRISTTNSNTNSNVNDNNDEKLTVTTSTTEGLALFANDIYQELLRKYSTMTKIVDISVHEYEYDGVYSDGNFEKDNSDQDEMLERDRELRRKKSNKNVKSKGKSNKNEKSKGNGKGKGKGKGGGGGDGDGDGDEDGDGDGDGDVTNKSQKSKSQKKTKSKKSSKTKNSKSKKSSPTASVSGLAGPPKSSLSKKDLIDDLTRVTKESLGIDNVILIQSSNPYKDIIVKVVIPGTTNCNNIYPGGVDKPDDVTTCYDYKIICTGINADEAIALITEEILSDEYTTNLGFVVLLKPTPVPDIASVKVLAAPTTSSSPETKLIEDLTRVTKELLDINDFISPSNVYKDCIVEIIIHKQTNCNNIYTSGEDIPDNVNKCYEAQINIIGSNADDAIDFVKNEILSDDFTNDLGFIVILGVSDIATVNGFAGPPSRPSSKKQLKEDITRVTKGILGFGSALSSSSPYKDCIVNVDIPGATSCENVYLSGDKPDDVTTCYDYKISITDNGSGTCNVKEAIDLITNDIKSDDYTTDLGFEVIINQKDLFDVTDEADDTLSDFAGYVQQVVDLADTLLNFKEITVFVPTNEAFQAFEGSIEPVVKTVATNLLTGDDTDMWKDHLEDLLNYHVLPVVVPSLIITNGTTTSESTVNDNGEVIEFTLKDAILGDTGIFVNTDAEVVEADIDIINGIVHVIDDVLLPPWVDKTIMDIATEKTKTASSPQDEEDLETLVAKLDEVLNAVPELVPEFALPGSLSAPGGYTVFAPTSAAFLEDDLKVTNLSPIQLSSVLNYHVVKGVYPESVLLGELTLTTLQGETLIFTSNTDDDNVATTKVNDENIITPNILANNGIVHIIDGVLIPDGSKDLFDVTDEADDTLSDFAGYVQQVVDLADTLLNFKEITVFVPTNEAFQAFEGSVEPVVKTVATNLLTGDDTDMWKDHLEDLLNYHVLPVVVPSLIITNGTTTSESTVNDNGEVIEFTLKDAILGDTGIFVNTDAEVVEADIDIINGIVHVIDDVLLPPWVDKTIMDIATEKTKTASSPQDEEDLETLVAKLDEVLNAVPELVPEFALPGSLSAPGGYTVFAPTSAAFLEDDLKVTNLSPIQLSSVLNYHVVKGVYPESVLLGELTLTTLQGETLIFTSNTDDDNVATTKVNDENIITPNILANNGIVHIIDGVLIPDGSKDLFDVTDEADDTLSDFAGYVEQVVDLADTLLNFKEITVFVPTNEAFQAFEGSVEPVVKTVATNLLTGDDTDMWKDHLEDLLNYHVLPVVVPSLIITNGTTTSESTVNDNGEVIEFTLKDAILGDTGIFVNTDAEVVEADIDIINGIVHVIDDVLLPPWVDKTIMDIATEKTKTASSPQDEEDLETLVAKLDEVLNAVPELVPEFALPGSLSAPGGYTVFAPTSAAFLEDDLKVTNLSPIQLSSVLNYHVVKGVYPESVLLGELTLTTLQGETLIFTSNTDDDNVATTKVNDENIITPNILANNGIVHIIDGVLIPDGSKDLFDVTDEADDTLSDFAGYVEQVVDLADTLLNFKEITVFVPTNEAFQAFEGSVEPVVKTVATNLLTGDDTDMWKDHLEDLLNYHVLPVVVPSLIITNGTTTSESTVNDNGEVIEFTLKDAILGDTGIFVNTDAEVVEADIDIINGIVHVIDDVLLPPWVDKTIMDIATEKTKTASSPQDEEDLETLVAKLDEVLNAVPELVPEFALPGSLSAPGGYTVFAPTSAAFLEDDLKVTNLSPIQLSSVLNYHVVKGVYPESVLLGELTLTTLQGETLIFTSNTDDDNVATTKVNDENIITPNILANNGIVHIIDGVLIPDGSKDLFDVTDEADDTLSDFAGYVEQVVDLADTLLNFKEITVFVPTNEAFQAFEGSVEPVVKTVATNLLTGDDTDMWKDHLEDLLNYHVLPVVVPSLIITNGTTTSESTVNDNGEVIEFTLKDAILGDTGIFVNTDAEVVEADIDIINGIVHVIDDVLLPPWVDKTIMDIATEKTKTASSPQDEEDLETLVAKLDEVLNAVPELVPEFALPGSLSAPGGYTVFAPTSAAFLEDDLKVTNLSPIQLSSVLNYHVVKGVYPESVLLGELTLTTLQGETLIFTSNTDDDNVATTKVNDENIITPNILANNGIVHIIDGVLIPDGSKDLFDVTDEADDTLSDFAGYVEQVVDLADTLLNFKEITVFVPTNEAFQAFEGSVEPVVKTVATNLLTGDDTDMWKDHLEDLLNYHVLPVVVPSLIITNGTTTSESTVNDNGEVIEFTLKDAILGDTGIFVNTDAEVVEADIDIINGIVHVIDDVLLPPWVDKTIVDIATEKTKNASSPQDEEDLETLVAKLDEVLNAVPEFALPGSLSAPGGYTVFAPTSAAFLEDDLKVTNLSPIQLSSVLNYHVVKGVYPESVLLGELTLTTLQGETLIFTSNTDDDNVATKVNDENIITSNILANNGIVHIIDGVLIPDGLSASPSTNPSSNPSLSAFPSTGPSDFPSLSASPSTNPSDVPSLSAVPSTGPSDVPSLSASPSTNPSEVPSLSAGPSTGPSDVPSLSASPSTNPSEVPSLSAVPSTGPSDVPSLSASPSTNPSEVPSLSAVPSTGPSDVPSLSASPSTNPSEVPSLSAGPSTGPSDVPSLSASPSTNPSEVPSLSAVPSTLLKPSASPSTSIVPSSNPSLSAVPSTGPSVVPSSPPSFTPSSATILSGEPSSVPSSVPSSAPSSTLSFAPSSDPATTIGATIAATCANTAACTSTTCNVGATITDTTATQPSSENACAQASKTATSTGTISACSTSDGAESTSTSTTTSNTASSMNAVSSSKGTMVGTATATGTESATACATATELSGAVDATATASATATLTDTAAAFAFATAPDTIDAAAATTTAVATELATATSVSTKTATSTSTANNIPNKSSTAISTSLGPLAADATATSKSTTTAHSTATAETDGAVLGAAKASATATGENSATAIAVSTKIATATATTTIADADTTGSATATGDEKTTATTSVTVSTSTLTGPTEGTASSIANESDFATATATVSVTAPHAVAIAEATASSSSTINGKATATATAVGTAKACATATATVTAQPNVLACATVTVTATITGATGTETVTECVTSSGTPTVTANHEICFPVIG